MAEYQNPRINPKLKYYQIPNKSKIPNPKEEIFFGILSLGFVW
jgi:hypothetical protein